MERGQIIDYTITLVGIRVRWRTMITTYEPPFCFVDEQMKGPYSFWLHRHTFESVSGGTLIRDSVRYALPLFIPGPLAALLHAGYVRPELERIFDFRRQTIQRVFGDGAAATAGTAAVASAMTQEAEA